MKKLWMNHHCRERRGPNQRNKRLHTKRTTLHFVVGNEQLFPLLLGTKNAFRIFMVLSETKSALVIKISQIIALFTVWYSDLLSILFFGRLDFFSGDITIISYGQVAISPKAMSPETWVMLPEKKIIMCEKSSVSGSCTPLQVTRAMGSFGSFLPERFNHKHHLDLQRNCTTLSRSQGHNDNYYLQRNQGLQDTQIEWNYKISKVGPMKHNTTYP